MTKKLIGLFLILLFGFAYADNFILLKEINLFLTQKEYLKAFVFLTNYLLAVVAVIFLLLNKYTKFITLFMIFATMTLEIGCRNLSGSGFGYLDASLILHQYSAADEGVKDYGKEFLFPLIESLLFVVLIYFYTRSLRMYVKHSVFIGIVLSFITFGTSYSIMKASNKEKVVYPVVFKEPSILFYAASNGLYVGKRKDVDINAKKPFFKHIVYIVDESIRGDKLGINGFDKNTTPFLNAVSKNKNFYNYGIASSGGVCSCYSNSILLTGIQLNQLPDIENLSRKNPIIFQYAKKAGFETSFFDMQNSRDNWDNFLQPTDIKNYVDYSFFVVEDYKKIPRYQRDLVGLKKLKDYIDKNKDKYTFTYFVKQGCHFSYLDKYPKNRNIFTPVLHDGGFWEWDKETRPKFLNTYYNCVNWAVDEFFKNLYKDFNNSDTLIVYTSDHAQNLMEYFNIKQTHCIEGPAPGVMAKVPLFIISMNNKPVFFKKENINKASHFNLFGSVLYFMGYDLKDINSLYGNTLFNNLSGQKRYFTSGDIFGRSPMYKNEFKLSETPK